MATIAPNTTSIPIAQGFLVASTTATASIIQPMIEKATYQSTILVVPGISGDNDEAGRMREKSTKKRSKPQREYAFRIYVDGSIVAITQWSSFGEIRDRMRQFIKKDNSSSPKFPSGSYFGLKNYITNESNARKRANSIAEYTNAVLRTNAIGKNTFHNALLLQPRWTERCVEVFMEIATSKEAKRNAIIAQLRAKEQAIIAQQRADCGLAQTFNQIIRNGTPLAPGQISTIAFNYQQKFTLQNRGWSYGDAIIRGSGELPWFKMIRTNGGFFSMGAAAFKNCHFMITNMAGEPLLAMQERFSWRNYVYELYRYDPHRPGVQIPVCRVTRCWSWQVTDQYVIELSGPMSHHPPVQCQGRWPSQFTLGNTAVGAFATVDKKMFKWTDTYNVTVSAGQDCLLFIGIACAIDRIHHEVEDERRRRENANTAM